MWNVTEILIRHCLPKRRSLSHFHFYECSHCTESVIYDTVLLVRMSIIKYILFNKLTVPITLGFISKKEF